MVWTEERIERLKALWAAGDSGTSIARQLGGTTRCAVIAKVHRMGLAARSESVKKANQKRATPRGRAVGGAAAPRPIKMRPPPAIVPTRTWAPVEPVAEHFEGPGRATILTIGAHMCRWPIGDPQDDGFTLCGRKTDRLYCEVHHARAFDRVSTAAKRTTADLARSLRRYA